MASIGHELELGLGPDLVEIPGRGSGADNIIATLLSNIQVDIKKHVRSRTMLSLCPPGDSFSIPSLILVASYLDDGSRNVADLVNVLEDMGVGLEEALVEKVVALDACKGQGPDVLRRLGNLHRVDIELGG